MKQSLAIIVLIALTLTAGALYGAPGDVYIAGYTGDGGFGDGRPCYWKNGAWHDLPVPETEGWGLSYTVASAIAIMP
jgi:hypothetical protein